MIDAVRSDMQERARPALLLVDEHSCGTLGGAPKYLDGFGVEVPVCKRVIL